MAVPKMYSTSDLGKMFGVERATVFNWIKSGRFPNVQMVGTSYGVPPEDVLAYAQAEKSRLTSELERIKQICEALTKNEQAA